MKIASIAVVAVALTIAVGASDGFAQFSGREILDSICKNVSPRGRRSDQGENAQKKKGRADPPAADSYDQTEHELALLESDLRLQAQQKESWQLFAGKISDYAGEISRERAHMEVPDSAGKAAGGLEHLKRLADLARKRTTELEEIHAAAGKLYATLSSEQKKVADSRIVAMLTPLPSEQIGGGNISIKPGFQAKDHGK